MSDQQKQNVTSAPHQLPPGTILKENYRIDRVLGQGGFGITYLGWDVSLDTQVAIKEYFPSEYVSRNCTYSNEVISRDDHHNHVFKDCKERFLREAQALAKFTDTPEIVSVLNFFEENGTAYIVQEFVDGIDLKSYAAMRGGTLTVEETFSILKPIMEALDKVHQAELVHRDISPDNIMMLSATEAILLDFGAVRGVAEANPEKNLTKSTAAILKLGFAPMEQYQSHGALGPWTDVYALCATIYYCLTGTVPPDAPRRIEHDIHPNWRKIRGLTEEQQEALENGMQIRTKDRIPSVKELYAQLFGVDMYSGAPIVRSKKVKKKPRKEMNTWVVAAVAAVVCLAAGAAAASFLLRSPGNEAPILMAEPQVSQTETTAETETSPLLPVSQDTELTVENTLAETVTGTEASIAAEETTEPVFMEESGNTWLYSEDAWKKNVLKKYTVPSFVEDPSTYPAFGSKIPRSQIKSVTFQDHIANAPADAWDVSQSNNASVLAWAVENGEYYDLYIGGIGGLSGNSACSNLFAYFTNLETITFGNAFHTEYLPSCSGMFYECSSLKSIDLSCLNTANTTDMSSMFYGCRSLERIDVRGFDTAKVNRMDKMFYNCGSLTKLDVSNFNTRAATNLEGMFYGCSSINNLDVSGFETQNVTNMSYMFAYCSGLTNLDVSNLNTSHVYKMNGMFQGCSGLESLDVSNFKTLTVSEMSYLFADCTGLTELDLSNFETSYTGHLDGLFSGCSGLKKLNIESISTEYAVTLRALFNKCSSLTSIDISHFNTEKVTDMGYMFSECSSLTELDVSSLDTKHVTNMENMFYMCGSLSSLDISNFLTIRCTDMSEMFYGCTNLIKFDFGKFSVGLVRDYENFMMEDSIVNGRNWEKLFNPYA